MVSQLRGEGEWGKSKRERGRKDGDRMDKGALHAKKSSRRDGDRQGHTEQGGPDREGDLLLQYLPTLSAASYLFIEEQSVLLLTPSLFLLVSDVTSATTN